MGGGQTASIRYDRGMTTTTRTLALGMPIPDFELPAVDGSGRVVENCRPGNHLGRWLLLLFYPRDFSLV